MSLVQSLRLGSQKARFCVKPMRSTEMYLDLQLPWSANPSKAESEYKNAGLVKTQGTIYLLPPDDSELVKAFESPPRPKSRMSAGAIALCKHFERGGASTEHGIAHPYWPLPVGSNPNKDKIAFGVLQKMLCTVGWRNTMMLHKGVAVYEIRNNLGYGMRWTLDVQVKQEIAVSALTSLDEDENLVDLASGCRDDKLVNDEADQDFNIQKISFRGFLEPIEGLEIEASKSDTSKSTSHHDAVTQPAT